MQTTPSPNEHLEPLCSDAGAGKLTRQAAQAFADSLLRLINSSSGPGASNFLAGLMLPGQAQTAVAASGESDAVPGTDKASPAESLERCALILRRSPETRQSLAQLFNRAAADCTSLSPSAPALQVAAEAVVWRQFRRVLDTSPAVRDGVREFVDSVRSGRCVLFQRDTDEDTIVESLFPDYKHLIVSKGAKATAEMLPELYEVRRKTSERINEFHQTAGSDDCKIVEVDGPKVEVRKELRDLEARKLHIVTKELIDELYEFYRQEMLSGVRATTGVANVPGCCCGEDR